MKQAHIIISGFVQGVGYRYFVRANASKLGLNGWVRNTTNGKVEAVFVGVQDIIEKMIALCKEGPMLSEVKDIQVEWEEIGEKFEDFVIR